jgi:hypothetical protein
MGHRRVIRYTTKAERPQEQLDLVPFHHYEFDDGTVWTEFYRSDKAYLLRFPGLADFEVSADGKEVVAYPAEECDEHTVEHLYINQLVPLALSRQGRPAFHASAVTVPGGAVAFLGRSGMGKSTLAASFALGDATFLTDDSLLIEETGEGCLVAPSHPSLRLWDDSKEALIDPEISKAAEISYSSKARLLAGKALAFCDSPQPLIAAFVLGREDAMDITISKLSGLDRYMSWLENSFLLDVTDRELLSQHFEWTDRVSASVPTFALDYPRDYGILPAVREAVRRQVTASDE